MKVEAYIHSLKDRKTDCNVLGEAEIIKAIGDNCILRNITASVARRFSIPLSAAISWMICTVGFRKKTKRTYSQKNSILGD